MPNYLNIAIFIFVFLGTTFWMQVKLLLNTLKSPKNLQTTNFDQKILSLIKTKTGYSLKNIYIVNSDKLFGMMTGLIRPHLMLSRKLYEEFNEDETEYVLLHEMAHYLLLHILKETVLGLVLLICGISTVVTQNPSTIPTFLLGLIFGIIMIRLGRLHEYEADSYSLSRITNPEGMISATNKFQAYYSSHKNKLMETLFYRGNPFSNRLRMAKSENSRRQNKK